MAYRACENAYKGIEYKDGNVGAVVNAKTIGGVMSRADFLGL